MTCAAFLFSEAQKGSKGIHMSSEAQIAANRANAALSTGPTTEAGKAKSSHNAVKTGLTGRTILLPTDDREIYLRHVARFFTKYQPVTDDEKALTQSVADTEWRLVRIPSLESGIYANGRSKLADELADESDPAVRAARIDAQVFQDCRKDLSNLALQEARLRRMRDADTAELKELLKTRIDKRQNDFASACATRRQVINAGNVFEPTLFGFEFTNDELAAQDEWRQAKHFALGEHSRLSKAEYKRFIERMHEQKQQKEQKAA
jgi:hypothetical protein